jgi:hypothetical protein
MTMPSSTPATPPTTPAPAAAGPALSSPAAPAPEPAGLTTQQKWQIAGAIAVAVVVLALLIAFVVFLVNSPGQAAVWRDIFIIFMALETFVIGAALIVLIAQLAVLTNLLKHEIRPILESTNETVNTLRGTALFVSENLTEPIIQLNSYVAALEKVVTALGALFSLGRKK